jgi:hypothetical protein
MSVVVSGGEWTMRKNETSEQIGHDRRRLLHADERGRITNASPSYGQKLR